MSLQKKAKYVKWNHTTDKDGNRLHLVKLDNGKDILCTSEEMLKMGFKYKKIN